MWQAAVCRRGRHMKHKAAAPPMSASIKNLEGCASVPEWSEYVDECRVRPLWECAFQTPNDLTVGRSWGCRIGARRVEAAGGIMATGSRRIVKTKAAMLIASTMRRRQMSRSWPSLGLSRQKSAGATPDFLWMRSSVGVALCFMWRPPCPSLAFNACAFGQDMAPLCLPDKRTARHNRAEKFPKASGPNRR